MKKSLRDYQQECHSIIKEKGRGSYLVVMATGTGKTFTFTSLPDTGRVLVIAHTRDLVTQPKSYYNEPVGIEMGNLKSNGERVILASMQSLKNRLDRFPPDYFDQVIIDECFHPETEVLTSRGWKRFDSLESDEKVAQVDVLDGNKITYKRPLAFINKKFNGELVSFHGKRFGNIKATPNHRMFFGKEFKLAKDIGRVKNYDVSGKSEGEEELTAIEKLMIIYQADGCNQGRDHYWTIQLTKERKIERFLKTCEDAGIIPSRILAREGTYRWGVRVPFKLSKNISDMIDISKCGWRKSYEIIEEMVHWDGSRLYNGSYYYSSRIKENRDFFQIAALQSGHKAQTGMQVDNRKESYFDMHRLYVTKDVETKDGQAIRASREEYNGFVHCVSMPKGTLIVRSNTNSNHPMVVGNCHHAVSNSYKKILDHFKPRQLLGFTATPNRADSVGLCSVFDEIIFERNIEWAIKQNYLSNLKCIRADLDWDLSKIATRLGDFSTKELNKIVNIQGANERISKIVAEKAIAPGIIFCVSIEHAKAIEELVPNSKVVIGETKDREEIFNRFKNGEINWLISVGVLTEGVDLPNAITAVVARPTKSAALYTQMVGRILRLYEGKEYGLVIDCVGNTQNHSLCSAPTLLGYEVNPAANFSPEDLEGDLFDLPDKIEKINDQPEVWLRNFKEVSLFRKDNKIDTRDLAFVVMPGGELILPYNRNEWIGIAKIDLAGMTEVIGSHGTKGGRKPAQVCIDLIFGWLLKKATNMNYCRESLIKRRPLLPPSTKQANYCRGLMRKYGYEFKKGMTARDAAVIISRLKSKEIYDRSRKTRRIP